MKLTPKAGGGSQHWAQLSEAGALGGMRFLFAVYRLGGPLLYRVCLAPAIFYFYLFRHQARRASFDYLKRVRGFAPTALPGRIPWLSFQQFWNFGLSVIDKLAVWQGDIERHDTTLHGSELIDQFLAAGQGGIFLISHLGNFEICRCLSASRRGIRLTVLMHTRHAEKFNTLLREQSDDPFIDVLSVTEITPATAMLLNERIERGEFVAIAGDRIAVSHPENKLVVNFLGEAAALPLGPFILASILKAPIITLFCLREKDGYHIYFKLLSEAMDVPRRQREQALLGLAERYAAELQDHCLENPLQWFNFFNFWHIPEVTVPPVSSRASSTGSVPR